MSNKLEVAVLFVLRGIDEGLATAQAFADALREAVPGVSHRLLFLAKAWPDPAQRSRLPLIASSVGAEIVDLPDDGYDWGAYFRALPSVSEPWICLLNSHSRPCAPQWLKMLLDAARRPGVGLAGATGSWESPRWSFSRSDTTMQSMRDAARSVRHMREHFQFDTFPNPHVRSTGVVLSTLRFSEFAAVRRPPRSKQQAHVLESGRAGLSAFMTRQGLELAVVGRDGHSYAPQDWSRSKTFRANAQANLLIQDNRTLDYATGSDEHRRMLSTRAWGQDARSLR